MGRRPLALEASRVEVESESTTEYSVRVTVHRHGIGLRDRQADEYTGVTTGARTGAHAQYTTVRETRRQSLAPRKKRLGLTNTVWRTWRFSTLFEF